MKFTPLPLFALFLALIAVAVAETSVTVTDRPNSPLPGKPAHPSHACTFSSRRCKSASNYTGLRFDHNLNLGVCHADGFWRSLWHRVVKGDFVNTFWVSGGDSCEMKDDEVAKVSTCDNSMRKCE